MFLKKIFYIVVIAFVLANCTGSNCVDANDFGEYEFFALSIPAKNSLCEWAETDSADGVGDPTIEMCIRGKKSASLSSNNSCTITVKSVGGVNMGFAKVKEGTKMSNPSEKFRNDFFTFTGCDNELSEANMGFKGTLVKFYNQVVDECLKECEEAVDSMTITDPYDTYWTQLATPLEYGREFYIKAAGSIDLLGQNEKVSTYVVGSKYLQQKNKNANTVFGFSDNVPLTLNGKFEMSVSGNGTKRPGEVDGDQPNLANRVEYLRRGVVLLQTIPTATVMGEQYSGSVTNNGTYTGPDLELNRDKIKCSVSVIAFKNNPVDCKIDYGIDEIYSGKTFEQLEDNEKNILANNYIYKLDKFFTIGTAGKVGYEDDSESVTDFIYKYPFKDFACSTIRSEGIYRTNCLVGKIDTATTFTTNLPIPKGYLFANDRMADSINDSYKADVNGLVFASKIMIRVVGAKSGTCNLKVKIPVSMRDDDFSDGLDDEGYYSFTVNANDKWHYVNDRTGNPIVFGKTNFHTLKETTEGRINVRTENLYSLPFQVESPNFANKTSWLSNFESSGIDDNLFVAPGTADEPSRDVPVPCGGNMILLVVPQNDVLVKTSGFVSFKNLVTDQALGECTGVEKGPDYFCMDGKANGRGDPSTGATKDRSFKLIYTILNPALNSQYAISADIKKRNFYEKFRTANYTFSVGGTSYTKYLPDTNRLVLDYAKWSDEVFVRKGQIIRFDENSFLNIEGTNENGYDVREALFMPTDISGVEKNILDGLIMHIRPRPALLCLSATREEDVSNAQCQLVYNNEKRTTECKVPYSQYCVNNSDDTEKTRYCPTGCYKFTVTKGTEGFKFPGYGNVVNSNVVVFDYQSFYVDEAERVDNNCTYPPEQVYTNNDVASSFDDPISLDKCKKCKEYIEDPNGDNDKADNKTPSQSKKENVSKCYDLEKYIGSVGELARNQSDIFTSIDNSTSITYNSLVFNSLGLNALGSIFALDNPGYGSLDGMIIDSGEQQNDGTYKKFTYNSPTEIKIIKPSVLRFLALNNDDAFDFSFISPDSYQSSGSTRGEYKFTFKKALSKYTNGANLAILAAHKDWNKQNLGENCGGSPCVKEWIIRYNADKDSASYGTKFDGADEYQNKYTFDTITGNFYNVNMVSDKKIVIGKLRNGVTSSEFMSDSDQKNTRMYFKIIDKLEEHPNPNCGGVYNKISKSIAKYSCDGSNYVDLTQIYCTDSVNGKNVKNSGVCPNSGNTGGTCKKENGQYVTPATLTTLSNCDTGIYYNNNGGYSVKVKTPKVFTNLNSINSVDSAVKTNIVSWLIGTRFQSFTVKRFLNPMIELMDGVNMGLNTRQTLFGRELIPCQTNGDTSGGNSNWKCDVAAQKVTDTMNNAGSAIKFDDDIIAKSFTMAGNNAYKILDSAGNTVYAALDNAGDIVNLTLDDSARVVHKTLDSAGNTVYKAFDKAGNAVELALDETGRTVHEFVDAAGKKVWKAIGLDGSVIEMALDEVNNVIYKTTDSLVYHVFDPIGNVVDMYLDNTGEIVEEVVGGVVTYKYANGNPVTIIQDKIYQIKTLSDEIVYRGFDSANNFVDFAIGTEGKTIHKFSNGLYRGMDINGNVVPYRMDTTAKVLHLAVDKNGITIYRIFDLAGNLSAVTLDTTGRVLHSFVSGTGDVVYRVLDSTGSVINVALDGTGIGINAALSGMGVGTRVTFDATGKAINFFLTQSANGIGIAVKAVGTATAAVTVAGCNLVNGIWNTINDNLGYTNQVSLLCTYYNPDNSNYDPFFGNGCQKGDTNCWETCNVLSEDDPQYHDKCRVVNDNSGFVKNFYTRVILDSKFHIILKILLTLMMTFLGLYHLMGLSEITTKEMLNRLLKIGVIYLFTGSTGWYYYNKFFITFFTRGIDYLTYAVAGSFDSTPGLTRELMKGTFFDKAILFNSTDKNLALIFSPEVNYKIWGLMFSSLLGPLYVILIYSALINYVFAAMTALITYTLAKFLMSLLLTFGPIFFVLLIFEKTKESFDKWIMALVGQAASMIALLTGLSLFNMLVYNFIKYTLNFRVCFTTVWAVEVPILGSFQVLVFWNMVKSPTSPVTLGLALPNLFRVLVIWLIADLMAEYIKLATNFGKDLAGSSIKMTDVIGNVTNSFNKLKDDGKGGGLKGKLSKGVDKKLDAARDRMGYISADDDHKREQQEKKDTAVSRKADRAGMEAMKKAKEEGKNGDEQRKAYEAAFDKAGGQRNEDGSPKRPGDINTSDNLMGKLANRAWHGSALFGGKGKSGLRDRIRSFGGGDSGSDKKDDDKKDTPPPPADKPTPPPPPPAPKDDNKPEKEFRLKDDPAKKNDKPADKEYRLRENSAPKDDAPAPKNDESKEYRLK
ncbi:MAG: hypothetical protein Ta2D_02730 [Rickettsiales bacterium]|nr:MAG: hypothetical protein Ta2D_02730 [Rickettsiales bacterium]